MITNIWALTAYLEIKLVTVNVQVFQIYYALNALLITWFILIYLFNWFIKVYFFRILLVLFSNFHAYMLWIEVCILKFKIINNIVSNVLDLFSLVSNPHKCFSFGRQHQVILAKPRLVMESALELIRP